MERKREDEGVAEDGEGGRATEKQREEIFQQRGINYDRHQLRVINYNVAPITGF